MNEPNNEATFVDPNTDDLDAFNDLLVGTAKVKTPENGPKDEAASAETENQDEAKLETVDEDNDDADGDDQTDDNSSDEDQPKPKQKKANRFQERINELTAKAREAERALDALKAEQAAKQSDSVKKPDPVVLDEGPTPDDKNEDGTDKYPLGEFDPKYIRDMARHTIDKEMAAQREQAQREQAERQVQEAREQLQEQWLEKLTPVSEQHEDFLDKTLQLEDTFEGLDPQYSDFLVTTIKSLDHGPEVLYYFANNLDEAAKVVRSGPLLATLALGEINAMFKGQTRKPEPKVSKAPPPPQVNKGTKARTVIAGDTDDLDAFSEIFFRKR